MCSVTEFMGPTIVRDCPGTHNVANPYWKAVLHVSYAEEVKGSSVFLSCNVH